MIILGVDPGNHITGYGLVNFDLDSREFQYISNGFIEDRKAKYPISLVYIPNQIKSIVLRERPDVVGIEIPQHLRGFKSHLQQAELIGCIKRVLVTTNTPYISIPASSLKLIVTGNGWASKEEVARTLSDKFQIPLENLVRVNYYKTGGQKGKFKNYTLDGSDALGLALALPEYIKRGNPLEFGRV